METSTADRDAIGSTVVLPPLIGTRPGARELCVRLPPEPGEVWVDATRLISAAQAVADELVAEVLAMRQAERMTVWGATPRLAQHMEDSARRRGVADRLTVSTRAER